MKPVIDICPPAKHLWISIPSYSTSVNCYHARSLAYAAALLTKGGINVTIDPVPGCCYLDHTRNRMAARFMASDATDILMIDDDVQCSPDAVARIATCTRPVVGGAYPQKADHLDWPVTYLKKGEVDVTPDGLVEVAMLPTGFLRINRAVFQHIDKGPYQYGPDEAIWRRYFRTGVKDGRYWGEDANFCRDWRSAGGKVFLLPDIDFAHWGMNAWEGNWAKWAAADIAAQKAS